MLIGRKKEQATLQALLDKEESQFCVVYGRRRVGKTYLIRETFHYQFAFQHTGVANGTYREQLAAFRDSLRQSGLRNCTLPKNWFEAFDRLRELLETAPPGKKVLFIDEFPWMDTAKSNIVGALEHFWNGWATARQQKDIVLIVCGSSTSWMVKKLLQNKGGLRGRLTEQIKLAPFTLNECEQYVNAANLVFSRNDILELYMILGGIPYYWSFLKPNLSVPQNVDELFFAENAKLKDEFAALYHLLFQHPQNYIEIIRTLSTKKSGMNRNEILKNSHLEDGGTFSSVLQDLEQCGFIRAYRTYGKKENGMVYQLIDNFTLFYYHCIQKNAFDDEHYWSHTYLTNEHNVWCGLAFERVCLQHISQLKMALGISGIVSHACAWQVVASNEHPGAQIDLLIVRSDNVVNVCEMKFSKTPFVITQNISNDLQNKIAVFKEVVPKRTALHLTMVTICGIAQNAYRGIVQSEVTMDELFVS